MRHNDLRLISLNEIPPQNHSDSGIPIWNQIMYASDISLLTSQWKTGKTTLLAGLLQAFDEGKPFLGRDTRPTKTWIVSEESPIHWAERMKLMPVGPHAKLLARPFAARPTFAEWTGLIDRVAEECRAKQLDLFVVDPLASFLPGHCESDAGTLLDALHHLHKITDAGGSVLLLHHPKKNAKQAGSLARGSGALLGFVDVSMELTPTSRWKADAHCRTLRIQSRHQDAPTQLGYSWNPKTGEFSIHSHEKQNAEKFKLHWQIVEKILTGRRGGIPLKEILTFWPSDSEPPSQSSLYEWLNLAFEKKLCRRDGKGTRESSWRYRLKNSDDDYYDRGEFPPILPLPPL